MSQPHRKLSEKGECARGEIVPHEKQEIDFVLSLQIKEDIEQDSEDSEKEKEEQEENEEDKLIRWQGDKVTRWLNEKVKTWKGLKV